MSKILCCPKEKICLSEEDLKYAIEAGMLGYTLFRYDDSSTFMQKELLESIMLCVTAQNLKRNG